MNFLRIPTALAWESRGGYFSNLKFPFRVSSYLCALFLLLLRKFEL